MKLSTNESRASTFLDQLEWTSLPVGLLRFLGVGNGEDGEGAVPPPSNDGPGGGGETGGLAGQGVVGDHGGVVSPEQSDGVPAAVVIPHVLLGLGETCQGKVPQVVTQKILSEPHLPPS